MSSMERKHAEDMEGALILLREDIRDLRAQLAAVTKERDEARAEDRDVVYRRLLRERDALRHDNADLLASSDAYELMLTQVGRERDALQARVAALEAALAPTCEIVEATLAEAMALPESVRISVRSITELVLAAVRARAGLDAKEGG